MNGYVDIYPHEVKSASGAVIKSDISAGPVGVQLAGYADAFSGRPATSDTDYPDCSAQVGEAPTTAEFDVDF